MTHWLEGYPLELEMTEMGTYKTASDPKTECMRIGDEKEPRQSVTDREAAVLKQLAYRRKVCEIGTGLGISTLAMAQTAQYIVTVDPDPWVQKTLWPFLSEAGIDCRAERPDSDETYDMFFVDGLHGYENVLMDLRWCLSKARPGFLIVMHDMAEDYPPMQAAQAFLQVNPHLEGCLIGTEATLGIIFPKLAAPGDEA